MFNRTGHGLQIVFILIFVMLLSPGCPTGVLALIPTLLHIGGRITNYVIRDALDYWATGMGTVEGNGPNPDFQRVCCSNSVHWNSQFGYGRPDAQQLFYAVSITHSLSLSASWQFYSNSGTEKVAKVRVQDLTTNTLLQDWVAVDSGLTVYSITLGHEISVQYQQCTWDGNFISLNHIDGSSGPPYYPGNTADFNMGASDYSLNSVYYVVLSC